MPSLSQTALTNGGTTLTLTSNNGILIHEVSYDDTWYQDNSKKDGGWSLEQIDPKNPCGGKNNWKASIHPTGGTPGTRNSIDGENPDVNPPKAVSTCQISQNLLEVFFNEPVSGPGLTTPSNYLISDGIGHPLSISMGGSGSSIILFLASDILPGIAYSLTVEGDIFDCSGNKLEKHTIHFGVNDAEYLDLVINEVMAKPEPVIGLPAHEYIELYNRSKFPINLKDWTISIGRTTRTFPCVSIMPEDYLIVTHSNAADYFRNFGTVAAIPQFPSLANSGATIIIYDQNGKIITSLTYSDSWYHDNNKRNGGWSLEQIDPNNPCTGKENWRGSADPKGGTPGKVNSRFAENSDNKAPELERVALIDHFTLQVFFNEPLDPATATDPGSYSIDNGIGNPIFAIPVAPAFKEVTLSLPTALKKDIIYTITVKTEIKDCVGNPVNNSLNTARFAIPDSLMPNDIIINEILFNPRDGGSDFVELYNRSEKIIDLKDARISSANASTGELTSVREIDEIGYLLFPGEYVVLTVTPQIVREHYSIKNARGFKQMEAMPSFANSSGRCVISLRNDSIIDRFDYTADMHFPLLRNVKGVSLERIDPNRPTSDETNWISAAESVGYATPGYKNSQFMRVKQSDDAITIDPKVFSPDNDGYNDVVNIIYKLDEPGYIGSITIYDSAGRLVRNLMRSELLAMEGVVSWDGINESREKASIGIYIVYVEMFDLKGTVKSYKKTCVLATRF